MKERKFVVAYHWQALTGPENGMGNMNIILHNDKPLDFERLEKLRLRIKKNGDFRDVTIINLMEMEA